MLSAKISRDLYLLLCVFAFIGKIRLLLYHTVTGNVQAATALNKAAYERYQQEKSEKQGAWDDMP